MTFWNNLLPPSARFFYSGDCTNWLLRNINISLPSYTVSHSRRP